MSAHSHTADSLEARKNWSSTSWEFHDVAKDAIALVRALESENAALRSKLEGAEKDAERRLKLLKSAHDALAEYTSTCETLDWIRDEVCPLAEITQADLDAFAAIQQSTGGG